MPLPITITTIKQLFVNMFDLMPSTVSDPSWHLFILDRSNSWKPLEFVRYYNHYNYQLVSLLLLLYSVVYDHCTILLVDSNDIGTLIPSPISVTDTRTSRCSTATPDNDLLELSPSPNDTRFVKYNSLSINNNLNAIITDHCQCHLTITFVQNHLIYHYYPVYIIMITHHHSLYLLVGHNYYYSLE